MDELVRAGKAFPCFCSDAELEEMRKEDEAAERPPVYRGRWSPHRIYHA